MCWRSCQRQGSLSAYTAANLQKLSEMTTTRVSFRLVRQSQEKAVSSLSALLIVALMTACGDKSDSRHTALAAPSSRASSVNLYAFTGADELAPAAKNALPMVYVPNSKSGTVTEIDPRTYQ